MKTPIWMPELESSCGGNTSGTGLPVAGRVFNVASRILQPVTAILQHLERGWNVPKQLGRTALAAVVLLALAHRTASAQASAAIQASVRVVDPSASAFPAATLQLSFSPRLSVRQPLRRDLRGATLLVEIPAPVSAPATPERRVTIIHW